MEGLQDAILIRSLFSYTKGTTKPLAELITRHGTTQQWRLTTNMKTQQKNTHTHVANIGTLCQCQQHTCEAAPSGSTADGEGMCPKNVQCTSVLVCVLVCSNKAVCVQQYHFCKIRDTKQTYSISSTQVNQRAFKPVTHSSLQVRL